MEYRILGRLEVLDGGQEVALGGAKQRAVLAVLLLHRREIVSIDRLLDELWGESTPPTAAQTVRVYVSRLRKTLGDGVLETRGRGYRLTVEPEQIDADRFDALVADGRAAVESGDAGRAVELFAAALELWRGPPLDDFTYEPFAQSEIARLEAARLTALEDRIDAELRLGRAAALVPELEQLVATHPLRERLVAGLMLALYRSGRQADALAVYTAARKRLVEQLGLEPGPDVRELEQRILQHDPTLKPVGKSIRIGRTRISRTRIAAATLTLALVLVATVTFGVGAAHQGPTVGGENGIVSLDAATGELLSAAQLLGTPGAVSPGNGSVWVAEPGVGQVAQIATASGSSVDRILVNGGPGAIVTGDGAIWVASADSATVTRIDPTTGIVTQTISLPGAVEPSAVAYGDGTLWVADSLADELLEIDPTNDTLLRTLSLDLQPSTLLIGAQGLWVAGYANERVEKLDPISGRVISRVRVGDGTSALTIGAGSLWVANSLDSTVSRIDLSTVAVTATIPVGRGPTALAVAGGALWVANQYSATVSRIDPQLGKVVGNVGVGGDPTTLTATGDRVWVGVGASASSHRGGTLVIANPGPVAPSNPADFAASVDPAFYFGAQAQFMGLAYDTLVDFQQVPGTGGLRLVPDLALSIPTPSDGGKVYAFRIRQGIRYSDGQPLRADDVRRGIERLFRLSSPVATPGIVGADACIRQPSTCNLAKGIVTDDATGTVTFHLTAPDPDFLFRLSVPAFSAPIPPGTPDHETGQHFVPGTGPYEIASVSDKEIRFVRNPYFREWSHAAKPDGYPDSIVWRSVASAQAGVTAIEQGRADWLWGNIPVPQYDQVGLQDPALLHSNPVITVDMLQFNTNLAPFNDVRVRQALNYAIDRAEIVRLYGGASFATPTCQLIIPGLFGYRRYCPYTLHPSPGGAYRGPDMALARRLVAESGTRGERIDLWATSGPGFVPSTLPEYVAGVLRSLGYQVNINLFSFGAATTTFWTHIQVFADGNNSASYPYPSGYLPLLVSCGSAKSNGWYCDPTLDREMQRAALFELSDPDKASTLWAAVDRQLTNDAVWVPTVNERDVEITSRRLHNYEYSPVEGFLADQAWLK